MNTQSKSVVMVEGLTLASAATTIGIIDTLGADYLTIDVVAGSGDAASTAVTVLRCAESDTDSAMTAHTDGDAITACVGAAVVSSTAGFALPALSATKQNSYRFNIDLKGRKRYIATDFGVEKNTVGIGMVGTLSRIADGADIVTQATGVDGTRVIVDA